VARIVLSRVPASWTEMQAADWLRRALAHNLNCDPAASPLETGGVFALVGPTGVGKTTTAAKLAARFALVHGVGSVGLVTLDAYRIGGSDQLRSFGRMLGVPVHVAHDAATLADLLQLFGGRRLVLIDTAGLGQRDQRVEMLLRALDAPQVRRLLVLNAAAQVETLDDVVCAYRGQAAAGIVVTKIDEAARLGGVVDCALRYRLRVVGLADGQRVPEDWRAPDAQWLVDRALEAARDGTRALDPGGIEALAAEAALAVRGAHV
jgi:flagellar biosynthesis protein FlhF